MRANNFQEYYDRYAERYAQRLSEGNMPFHDQIQLPIFKRYAGTSKYSFCLDIGCGIGYYTKRIAENCKHVIGIDLSEKMLKQARNSNVPSNVEFIKEDILKYQPPYLFDIIFAGFMPSYFPDLQIFFDKLAKITTNKGVVLTSVIHPIRMTFRMASNQEDFAFHYKCPGIYLSDFLSQKEPLQLHKHTYSDIENAYIKAGFRPLCVDEPVLPIDESDSTLEHSTYQKREFTMITYKLIKV